MALLSNGWRQHIEERQTRLEGTVNEIRGVVGSLGSDVSALGGKIDRLADGLTDTAETSATRATAVKTELRDETDRKAKERNGMAMVGIGMIGAIGLIVAALTGPWKERLETTAQGQQTDTASIAAVREVLAQQGAGIGQVHDQSNENDKRLRAVEADEAFQSGWMTARYGYPGH